MGFCSKLNDKHYLTRIEHDMINVNDNDIFFIGSSEKS